VRLEGLPVKNRNDPSGNGNRDHPAESAERQPSVPPGASQQSNNSLKGRKMIRDGWMVWIKTAKEQAELEEIG
jgi:hypothetical protein